MNYHQVGSTLGIPGGTVVKNPPANAGDPGSIPGSGRSSGEGNGNPLQNSCLENFTDRGAWWATVRGVRHDIGHNVACLEPLQQTCNSSWQFSDVQEHSVHFKHTNEKSPLFIHC